MKENDGPIEHPGLLCQLCVSCFGFGDGGVFLPLQVRPGHGYDLNLDQIPNTRPSETIFFVLLSLCEPPTMLNCSVSIASLVVDIGIAAETCR